MSQFQDADFNAYPPRPEEAFLKIIECLEPYGERIILDKNDIFDVNFRSKNPRVYVILEGEFSVHRRSDSLIIATGRAPASCGLIEYIQQRGFQFCKPIPPCTVVAIHAEVAVQAITDHNLWKEISIIMMWYVQMLSARDEHLVGVSAYSMLRNKLMEIMNYPIERRRSISVASYVISRTMLSRSTIMRMLSDLLEGGYITMENGKLLDMKKLPEKY